jgi:hypothetical protein
MFSHNKIPVLSILEYPPLTEQDNPIQEASKMREPVIEKSVQVRIYDEFVADELSSSITASIHQRS